MKRISKILMAIALVVAIVMSFAACSSDGGNKAENTDTPSQSDAADKTIDLQAILDNFKADGTYAEYKAMYPDATFEEKLEGDSIVINYSGVDGASGSYEFKLDGDYLTYTQADPEDYVGYSYMMYFKNAADKYNGMDSNLTTGYTNGCDAFGIENKYFITETDEAGATTIKLYVAGKWDMPKLDTMYVNDKALEYVDALNESDINGAVNCGKIRVVYYGTKDNADIFVGEYGGRSDLTYQSIMNTVAKLLPEQADVFSKYYTELKEAEGDGFKVSFDVSDDLKADHEVLSEGDYEYTLIHFGA